VCVCGDSGLAGSRRHPPLSSFLLLISSFFFFFFLIFGLGPSCWLLSRVEMRRRWLIRQDPGFKVNMDHGDGVTLLHLACRGDNRSAVIPLLLAHPDIDVNVKDIYGWTPFFYACGGRPSCVREMLKDSRVKVNEPYKDGKTPLRYAACFGHLDIIKWWIASGREIDLGKPGDVSMSDAIGGAKENGKTEVVTLLEIQEGCHQDTE